MSSYMLLKVRQLGELAFTYLTLVRLDPSMDAVVLRQVGRVRKTFLTLRASKR